MDSLRLRTIAAQRRLVAATLRCRIDWMGRSERCAKRQDMSPSYLELPLTTLRGHCTSRRWASQLGECGHLSPTYLALNAFRRVREDLWSPTPPNPAAFVSAAPSTSAASASARCASGVRNLGSARGSGRGNAHVPAATLSRRQLHRHRRFLRSWLLRGPDQGSARVLWRNTCRDKGRRQLEREPSQMAAFFCATPTSRGLPRREWRHCGKSCGVL